MHFSHCAGNVFFFLLGFAHKYKCAWTSSVQLLTSFSSPGCYPWIIMDFIDIVLFSERENLVIIKSFHNFKTNELTSNRHHHQLCIVSQESPGFHHVFSSSASHRSHRKLWQLGLVHRQLLGEPPDGFAAAGWGPLLEPFRPRRRPESTAGFLGRCAIWKKNIGMKISTFLIRMYMIIFLGWADLQDVPVEDVSHRQVATFPYISSTRSLCARG